MNRCLNTLLSFFLAVVATGQDYDPQVAKQLADRSIEKGNPGRGAIVFSAATTACLSCHKVGKNGGDVGPDLSEIAKKQQPHQLAESILWPKRVVADQYKTINVATDDGTIIRGYRIRETDDELVVRDLANNQERTIQSDDVVAIKEVGTLMPDGLLATLSDQDKYDLVAFMSELGKNEKLSMSSIDALIGHAHGHHPAEFDMPREPIDKAAWPSWQAHINRDRVYDYYAKQARHFRNVKPRPHLLREFGELDGGTYGHWGNQSDAIWASDAWNDTDLGSLLAGVFHGKNMNIARSVCVRVGEGDTAVSAVFDPDAFTFRRVWSGGFVKFTSVRHGFMSGLIQDGDNIDFAINADLPYDKKAPKKYLGYYRHGSQVLFAYRVGDIDYLDTLKFVDGKLTRSVAPRDEHPDKNLIGGGVALWPQAFNVKATLGSGDPYAVDKINLPTDNPWNAEIFCGDHDFLSDGSAIVCTMRGDVWKISGLDESLSNVTWRRIASGLHQSLGLVVHNDQIYVLGRDQLTRLHDLNDDGEMDFYECFSNAVSTSKGGHDFTCGLFRDADGNFFTASGKQGVVRISADGQRADILASGLRNSDGIGLTPDGLVTAPSSEGDWMPASMIAAVRPDGPVLNRLTAESPDGRSLPFFGRPGTKLTQPPDLPMLYLPRGVDNSSGGQVHIDSDRWGPVKNQMVHLSYGAGAAFLLLRDEFDGWIQGAAVPIAGEFASGAHRGKFNPRDGQLYVSGMGGWGTYTTDLGCFQRVRYTGKQAMLPISFHVHENGIKVQFTQPVDKNVVEDPDAHFVQAWNYRYSGAYGSPEYSTRQMGLRGHDVLAITSATVLPDRKSVFIEIPNLQPVNQLHLLVKTGDKKSHDLFMTVHKLDKPFSEFSGYVATDKTILPHPMLVDFNRPRAVKRNPHRKMLADARSVDISAAKNLMYDKSELRAKAGEVIQLTFHNPDAVPHNWALLKPGALQSVGEQTNKLISDPAAAGQQYIPKTKDVLVYTDVVEPNGKFTVYFRAPKLPGRYPYICTFPGHWMVMNGTMIVQ